MLRYYYGMTHERGFGPGCQPTKNLVDNHEDPTGKYHHILVYSRKLEDEVAEQYDLEFMESRGATVRELLTEDLKSDKVVWVHSVGGEILDILSPEQTIEKYGDRSATGAYTEYGKINIWIV